MRQIATFLSFMLFCSCRPGSEQTSAVQNTIPRDSIATSFGLKTDDTLSTPVPVNEIKDWARHQDSLRNEILRRKDNAILKNSFLQEMYIRNVAGISGNEVAVKIPFDLHSPDCGAPDCYSTQVSFSFMIGDKLVFPSELPFLEFEHGCVDKEQKVSGTFRLVESNSKLVIYHSTAPQRTLVLFSSTAEIGTTAFYFTGLGAN